MSQQDKWLLYTSHKELNDFKVLGIFDSEDEAWNFYRRIKERLLPDDDPNVPFVEKWGSRKLEPT